MVHAMTRRTQWDEVLYFPVLSVLVDVMNQDELRDSVPSAVIAFPLKNLPSVDPVTSWLSLLCLPFHSALAGAIDAPSIARAKVLAAIKAVPAVLNVRLTGALTATEFSRAVTTTLLWLKRFFALGADFVGKYCWLALKLLKSQMVSVHESSPGISGRFSATTTA